MDRDTRSMNRLSNNTKKILLFGVLSFLLTGFITGIPTVIWSHQALSEKNRALYSTTDRRMVIGGMILGYLGIALSAYIVYLLLAAYLGWSSAAIFAPAAI